MILRFYTVYTKTSIHNFMKHALILLLFLSSTFSVMAQGIQFNTSSWAEIVQEAKKQDKLIFLDAYTVWCGPCKYMTKNVFVDDAVGAYYNEHFINVKMDMERGEGKEIAKKYDVQAYPSLFFINADEEVVHMSLGAQDIDGFIALGKAALNPSSQLMSLQKKFEKGQLAGESILRFASASRAAGSEEYESIADAYLKDQDWKNPDIMKHIYTYALPSRTSKYMKYIMENPADFAGVIGKKSVASKIDLAASMDARVYKVNTYDLEELTEHMKQYYSGDNVAPHAYKAYLSSLMYSEDEKHLATFVEKAPEMLKADLPLSSSFYNSVAWELYLNTEKESVLKDALKLVDRSLKTEENFYNTDTKAHILYKLGKKIKALVWAKKSVAIAEKGGDDASATLELIKKINGE